MATFIDVFEEFLPDNFDDLDGEELSDAVEAAVDAYITEYGLPSDEMIAEAMKKL